MQLVLAIEMITPRANAVSAAWAAGMAVFPCLVLGTWGLSKSGRLPLTGLAGEFLFIAAKVGAYPAAACCRSTELAMFLGGWAVHVGLLAGVFMFRRHGGLA